MPTPHPERNPVNTNLSEALDDLHRDCMNATRELRTLFMRTKRNIVRYEMPPCPPRPPRTDTPVSVLLDKTAPHPRHGWTKQHLRPHVTGQPW